MNVVERARYYFMKHRTAFRGKAVSKKKEDKHVLPLAFMHCFMFRFTDACSRKHFLGMMLTWKSCICHGQGSPQGVAEKNFFLLEPRVP